MSLQADYQPLLPQRNHCSGSVSYRGWDLERLCLPGRRVLSCNNSWGLGGKGRKEGAPVLPILRMISSSLSLGREKRQTLTLWDGYIHEAPSRVPSADPECEHGRWNATDALQGPAPSKPAREKPDGSSAEERYKSITSYFFVLSEALFLLCGQLHKGMCPSPQNSSR